VGSSARYLIALWLAAVAGSGFPWGTLSVNIAGSFLIGLVATIADEIGAIGPDTRVLLITGVLGGFTTFSAFSLETARLVEENEMMPAALNVLANVLLGLAAVVLGIMAGRAFER
jgi:CrcB protein